MFQGVDYYGIEADLGSEARMIRDAVRQLVDREFLPVVRDHYRAGTFPLAIVPKLGEMGLLG